MEWNIPHPAEGRCLRDPEGRICWLSKQEADQLLAAAANTPHLLDYIRLGLNTVMRKGELLGLERRRVDLKTTLVDLGSAHQKSRRHGRVPLNGTAREALLSA